MQLIRRQDRLENLAENIGNRKLISEIEKQYSQYLVSHLKISKMILGIVLSVQVLRNLWPGLKPHARGSGS